MDFPLSTGITQRHDVYPFIAPSKFSGSLTGKIVLITGASRGIGRATALAFAASGASLALLSRSTSSLSPLLAEIASKYKTPTFGLSGNPITSAPDIIARVEKEFGGIDVLVNNAGVSHMVPFTSEAEDMAEYWNTFEVNVRAPIALMHAILPGFIARGKGTIITVGSSVADIVAPYFSAYAASKAAILKASQILDLELKEKSGGKIRAFVLHPGAVVTDMSRPDGEAIKTVEMRGIMEGYQEYLSETKELPAWSMVALAVLHGNGEGEGGDKRIGVLGGRYWDVCDDLGELLDREKEIEAGNVGHLRVRKL